MSATSSASEVYYVQSSLHRAARRLLAVAARVLPRPSYEAMVSLAFVAYRTLVRLGYLRFFVVAWLKGDRNRMTMVERVFRVMPHSLVGWRGLEATYTVVQRALLDGCPGSVVECGVARGGCAGLMGLLCQNGPARRPLWLFDSYRGLPDPTADDFRQGMTGMHVRPLPRGSCLGTYEAVAEFLFATLGLPEGGVFMVQGWFEDALPANRQRIGPIAVLRIDADWYESVKCCLNTLYDSVSPGGFVIIDDYGSCFGAQKAVDEVLALRQVAVSLVPDGRGGIYFQKPLLH
jgi:O-methyltransferase